MQKARRTRLNSMGTLAMLALGITLTATSMFYASSFLAILGVAIVFWAAILLYITPAKQVPLTLLNASANANASNIERVLTELNLTHKGIYLPPRNLSDIKSSLVFMRETSKTPLPQPEEINGKLFSNTKDGVFLTPPGLSLSRLFEQELGVSFAKIDLAAVQNMLPKLLVEDMELAENAEVQIQNGTVTVEITGSITSELCQETIKQPRTHEQVGCLLTSAIACALAKASGKPVTIQKETQDAETKTTHIEYSIEEE